MGLCASNEGSAEEIARNQELERRLRKDKKADAEIHKLLLLGAGQSGKSTVFKQMISIYGDGFPEVERKTYKSIIHGNVIQSMQTLIREAQKRYQEEKKEEFQIDSSLNGAVEMVDSVKGKNLDEKVAHAISQIWQDKGIRKTFEVRAEFQLNDSAPYYFDAAERLGAPNYIPTEDDVMRSRARTTGVIQNQFSIDGNRFVMFDVGGQRSERKKWIHCFENVSAVLYVCAISAYNQVLFEDGETNRLVEALELFDEIINSRWFAKSSVILFLNKRDLFAEKIMKCPITVSPPLADYDGDLTDFAATTNYIIDVFDDRNKLERRLYPHLTCGIDRDNVVKVFNSVKDTVMQKGLADAGLTPMTG